MLFQNMNTFTQTRFDLLNRENLNNILSVKETIFKKKSKETIN